ncbi:MAG: DUF4347 domain-containing protein [Pirellulaceae bacterium]
MAKLQELLTRAGLLTPDSVPLQAELLEDRVLMSATPLPVEGAEGDVSGDPALDGTGIAIDVTLDEIDAWMTVATFGDEQETTGDVASTGESTVDASTSDGGSDSALVEAGTSDGDSAVAWVDLGPTDDGVSTTNLVSDLSQDQDSSVSQVTSIIFVDGALQDIDQLVESFSASLPAGSYEVIILDSSRSGIDQITETLGARAEVKQLHILSHGSAGQVTLGNTVLAAETIDQFQADLAAWGQALSADADILFYGCDLAADESGRTLIETIASRTQADVAASDDLTGHQDLGGDWELEFVVGDVETSVVVSAEFQNRWMTVLDINSGLLLHNTFDSDASDSSGNNYDGTLINGASINTSSGTNQVGDGKVSLNGSNDYVDLSTHIANFDNLGEGTIAVWVYADTTSGSQVIFQASDSGDNDSRVAIWRNADEFTFFVREGSTTQLSMTTSAANITQGSWNHIAVTVGADGNKFYVNGVQQGVSYSTGNSSTNKFFDDVSELDFLGWGVDKYNGTSFGGYFDGFIDDGRVYDRVLSQQDITQLVGYHDTIIVDGFADTVDGNTSDVASLLASRGADGKISLREAIIATNNDSDSGWSLQLSAGTYSLSTTGDAEDWGLTGDLDIRTSLTIVGAGADLTTIDGTAMSDRLMQVFGGSELYLSNLTLTGGSGDTYAGGAIHNAGMLVAEDTVFDGNQVGVTDGGTIYSIGTATLDRVAVINSSAYNGGAILVNGGTFELLNSTLSGNSSVYDGAALSVKGIGTTVNIEHSTIADNQATNGHGGGIKVDANSVVTMSYSIVADNFAQYGTHDFNGELNSGGYNIIETSTGLLGADVTDIVGTDPGLSALTLVGSTYVHTIGTSSIAYDAATGSTANVDQTGSDRDASPDIGAYEYQPARSPDVRCHEHA